VVSFQSLYLLLNLAVSEGIEIHQMYIKTEFFGQDLSGEEQTIYMKLPSGILTGPQEDMVLKLHKRLYIFKQSSLVLNKVLHGSFALHGLQRGEADHCVYLKASQHLSYMVDVDDIVMISDLTCVQSVQKKLNIRFEMSDLRLLSNIFGIAVT